MNVHDAEKPDSGDESRRKSERCFSSSTDGQTRVQTDTYRQTVSSQACRKADVLIDRKAGLLIDREEGRQTYRQTGRQTD